MKQMILKKKERPRQYLNSMTELVNRDAFLYRWYKNTEKYK